MTSIGLKPDSDILDFGVMILLLFLVGLYACVHHAPVLADTEGEIPL